MSDKEVERLKRLREQQIRARDPRQADRKRHQVTSRRPREQFSLRHELSQLGAKVTWMLWGAVIGLFLGLGLSWVLSVTLGVGDNWGLFITLGTVLVSGSLGSYFGSIRDSGREGWR